MLKPQKTIRGRRCLPKDILIFFLYITSSKYKWELSIFSHRFKRLQLSFSLLCKLKLNVIPSMKDTTSKYQFLVLTDKITLQLHMKYRKNGLFILKIFEFNSGIKLDYLQENLQVLSQLFPLLSKEQFKENLLLL